MKENTYPVQGTDNCNQIFPQISAIESKWFLAPAVDINKWELFCCVQRSTFQIICFQFPPHFPQNLHMFRKYNTQKMGIRMVQILAFSYRLLSMICNLIPIQKTRACHKRCVYGRWVCKSECVQPFGFSGRCQGEGKR